MTIISPLESCVHHSPCSPYIRDRLRWDIFYSKHARHLRVLEHHVARSDLSNDLTNVLTPSTSVHGMGIIRSKRALSWYVRTMPLAIITYAKPGKHRGL